MKTRDDWSSGHRVIGPSAIEPSSHRAIGPSGHRAIGSSGHRIIGSSGPRPSDAGTDDETARHRRAWHSARWTDKENPPALRVHGVTDESTSGGAAGCDKRGHRGEARRLSP